MPEARATALEMLRRRLDGRLCQRHPPEAIPLGISALDAALGGGLPAGALTEIVAPDGAGGLTLACLVAGAAIRRGGLVALVEDREAAALVYPPALHALGLDLDRVLWVRPRAMEQALWAFEELLGSGEVRCAMALGRMGAESGAIMRRFQWAAREGGGLGLWVHDGAQPMALRAPLRLEVTEHLRESAWLCPARRVLSVTVDRRPGGGAGTGGSCLLEVDHETGAVSDLSELAPATGGSLRSGGWSA